MARENQEHPLLLKLREAAKDTPLPGVLETFVYLYVKTENKEIQDHPKNPHAATIKVKTRYYGRAKLEYHADKNTIRGQFERRDNQTPATGQIHEVTPEGIDKLFHEWSAAGIRFLYGTRKETPHWVVLSNFPGTLALYVQNRITGECGIIPKTTSDERLNYKNNGAPPALWPYPERVVTTSQLDELYQWLQRQGQPFIDLRGMIKPELVPQMRNKIRQILNREPGLVPANDYARIEHLLNTNPPRKQNA